MLIIDSRKQFYKCEAPSRFYVKKKKKKKSLYIRDGWLRF